MNLKLVRQILTDRSTTGSFYLEEEWQCYTLEDRMRKGEKVPGQTAIPFGKYETIISYSNRFKRLLPLLLCVPGFTGIRIHPGNTPEDTEGCILVGMTHAQDFVGASRTAFNELFPKIHDACQHEKVFVEIVVVEETMDERS